MSRQVRAVGTSTAEGAVLRVPAARAHDIAIRRAVSVDTHVGLVPGSVSRIDRTPTNGLVTVDVRLTGALPQGARPGLTVDGIVELERLENVVYVGMPAFTQEHSTRTIFKVIRGCDLTHTSCEAVRERVRFGRASINAIEIIEGLEPGDQVVLSDTSAWDGRDRIRLN